jgi:hypothetical protein
VFQFHSVRYERRRDYAGLCECLAKGAQTLVQANPCHWFYLREIGLPTLSSTARRIETAACEHNENDQEIGMANRYLAEPAGTARTQRGAGRGLATKRAATGMQRSESPAVANP